MHKTLFAVALLLAAALPRCSMTPPEDPSRCPLAAEKPMVQIELFFGRDIPGRAPLSDAEWETFSDAVLSKEFPDGLTVLNGTGRWLDPRTNTTTHESSILVLTSVDRTSPYEERIAHVVDAYKKQFNQESVGVVTEDVCAQF